MVFIELNGFDKTNSIYPDTFHLSSATSDPLSTLDFDFYDPGSLITLAVGNPVTVWDETGSTSTIAQPTRNLVQNVLLFSSGGTPNLWTAVNTLTVNPLSYQIDSGAYGMKATFANNTNGSSNYSEIYQDVGNTFLQKVWPGQTYYVSIGIYATGTVTNIQAFIGIQFTDAAHNLLGIQTTNYVTPTSGVAQIISTSKVAPAGAVYARVIIGAQETVSGTNSGVIWFGEALHNQGIALSLMNVVCEPAIFPGRSMADGTAIAYPTTHECTSTATDCISLPDGTSTRERWLFNGYIKDLKVTYEGKNRRYALSCLPMGDVIDNGALVSKVYESTNDQAIVNDVVNNNFSTTLSTGAQNIWVPSTTVQLGQSISSVAYVDETFRDIMNSLSDATGFIYYIDEYNYVWYNDTPFNYASITLDVDNADYATKFPPQNYEVEYDGTQLRNSVKVLGGQMYTIESDVFSGNGSTTAFTLASQPQNIISISTNGGTSTFAPTSANKVGVKGQDTLGSGGIVVYYDPNTKIVTFNAAPGSGTNNVVITYATYRNVSVLVEDNQSIANFGRKFAAKVTDTSITDSTTAQTRGIAEIGKFSEPLTILTFELSSTGSKTNMYIPRGTTVLINSAADGFVAQAFVVQQVDVKSEGAGINIYSYTCGVYRPSMLDAQRHHAKALQVDTANGTTSNILLTVEMLQETTYYSESLTAISGGSGPYVYGQALVGYSTYT